MTPATDIEGARRAGLAWVARFRSMVAREADALCAVAGDELGKPAFETMTAEIIPLLSACRWTEKRARRILRSRRVPGGGVFQVGQRHRVVRAPLGEIAIIATWNYPVQLLGVQLVQAIGAGNRVWVKPSERSPATQGLLLDLAERAADGNPLIHRVDATREAGERLLLERSFDHVVFTGSTGVGRAIAGRLAETLTPSTLELSGSDSAIVLADADLRLAARSIAFALRLNAGQTCMAPRRVLVEEAVEGAFTALLVDALATERETTTPRPDELERSRCAAEEAVARGGTWLAGGEGVPPFVVRTTDENSALSLGRHFGPAMAVMPVASLEEALRVHAAVPQRLATAVFTRDLRMVNSLVARLGSSVVTINDCVIPTGHPGVGIGGIGDSGWGVSRGSEGLLAMTRPVFVCRTRRWPRTPLDEPGDGVKRSLAGWVRRLYG